MSGRKRGRTMALFAGLALLVVLVLGGGMVVINFDSIRAEYRLYTQFEYLRPNPQGCREYRHRRTGIVFVRLPGGSFLMGSPETEAKRCADELEHEVTVSPFLIAKYEVMQIEWQQIMGQNPSRLQQDDLPVAGVSWDDCQEFCKETRLKLPMEAQWEYACRAGTNTPFAFGNTITTDDANYNGKIPYDDGAVCDCKKAPLAGDCFKPNGFGLFNMHGNLWEPCQESFEIRGSPRGELKVMRGGSWGASAASCRSAFRSYRLLAKDPGQEYGFRPAWTFD